MAKSKLFRMFVAGTTISDGRTITPEMIDQVVETFDPATYTPRINVEHFKGFSPEPPFNGYGDVIHVEARDDEITIAGKPEKRRALYGQVEGNDQLVKLAKADQKPFPSVELTPAYAGTDKVGLIGLAFTDSPASIATQRLQFSRSAPGTLRAHDDAVVTLEFDEAPADSAGIAAAIVAGFGKVATMFARAEPEKAKEEPKTPANDNFDPAAFATAMGTQLSTTFAELLKPVTDAQAATARDLAALKTQLAGTEAPGFSRQPSPGGQGKLLADC